VYDVTFLVLFTLWVFWFLKSRKKNIGREGIIFMYRTQFGVKAMEYVSKHYTRTLHALKYVIVGVGFVLMGAMVWMLGQTVAIYLLHSNEITQFIKAPPVAPLIPYFPKLFGMESFFPPFYFAYFIVALAIVAIVHEFSHGIFMRLFKVRIKSTGLVFLGPILGAFVEQDDKSFQKKDKFKQMVILGAGVFANVVFALIFYGLYVGFFFSSFSGAGYVFNSYGGQSVPIDTIDSIGQDVGPIDVISPLGYSAINLSEVNINGTTYYMSTGVKELIAQEDLVGNISVLDKSPAILAGMRGAIIQADDVKIINEDKLREFLENKHPGERVLFVTEDAEGIKKHNILLSEHPNKSISYGYLGVGRIEGKAKGVIQRSLRWFMSFKDSSTYYKPTWDGNLVEFIYHLFWWVMVINLLVALFNMLPLGMLDGGRFFYLAIWGITGKEKIGKAAYKGAGWLILLAFILMMVFWFFGII